VDNDAKKGLYLCHNAHYIIHSEDVELTAVACAGCRLLCSRLQGNLPSKATRWGARCHSTKSSTFTPCIAQQMNHSKPMVSGSCHRWPCLTAIPCAPSHPGRVHLSRPGRKALWVLGTISKTTLSVYGPTLPLSTNRQQATLTPDVPCVL